MTSFLVEIQKKCVSRCGGRRRKIRVSGRAAFLSLTLWPPLGFAKMRVRCSAELVEHVGDACLLLCPALLNERARRHFLVCLGLQQIIVRRRGGSCSELGCRGAGPPGRTKKSTWLFGALQLFAIRLNFPKQPGTWQGDEEGNERSLEF